MNHIEAMKQALEFIEANTYGGSDVDVLAMALRTAIEQAEKQEPVAFKDKDRNVVMTIDASEPIGYVYSIHGERIKSAAIDSRVPNGTPLYTAPPAAPVQELERLRDENERLHVENRRLIDRIETMGVPVGIGGFLTTTNAAQRQWVSLTDGEALTEAARHLGEMHVENCNLSDIKDFARAIEAKLREKNS